MSGSQQVKAHLRLGGECEEDQGVGTAVWEVSRAHCRSKGRAGES